MGHRRDLCMNCIWVQLRSFTISINQQSLYTDYDDDDDDDDDVGLDVLGCRVDTDYIVYIIYIYIYYHAQHSLQVAAVLELFPSETTKHRVLHHCIVLCTNPTICINIYIIIIILAALQNHMETADSLFLKCGA